MAVKFSDLVQVSTTTTGTGALTVAAMNGYIPFETVWPHTGAAPFWYFIVDTTNGAWEYGTGHMSAASTLARDTVINSSAGLATLVTFGAGTKVVYNDVPAEYQIDVNNGIQLLDFTASNPITPSSGVMISASLSSVNALLQSVDQLGFSQAYQPMMWGAPTNILTWSGANSPFAIGNNSIGTTGTNVVTASAAATGYSRIQGYTSGASTGTFGRFYFATGCCATAGGFIMATAFNTHAVNSTMRCFVGVLDTTTPTAIGDPSAYTNSIGAGWDSGDTNLSWYHNTSSGTATKTTMGASFPASTTTNNYQLIVVANAGAAGVWCKNLVTGAVFKGSSASNIPVSTTILFPSFLANTGPTSSTAVGISSSGMMLRNFS